MNQALLTKLAWRFINEPNTLWSHLLRAKYGGGRELLHCLQSKVGSSHIWRGMVDSVTVLGRLKWKVGDGSIVLDGFMASFRTFEYSGCTATISY